MRNDMKSIALFLFCFFTSFAYSAPDAPAPISTTVMPPLKGADAYIMIDPKSRASDLKEAFDLLKREKTAPKVLIQLSDGSSLSNIVDLSIASSGTLLIIKINGAQGLRYQIVAVEDVSFLSHL